MDEVVFPHSHRMNHTERTIEKGNVPGTGDRRYRVLIVDAHPVMRHGLFQLIDRSGDLKIVGEADTPQAGLEAIATAGPHVVISDIALNGNSAFDFIRAIKSERSEVQVLIFSHYDEATYAPRALRAGANGYVMKGESGQTVLQAIHTVLNGEIYLSAEMAMRMFNSVVNGKTPAGVSPVDVLSDRQLEVFELIGRCFGSREISEQLQVNIKTVNSHRAQIKKKLAVHSATALVRRAVEWVQSR